MSELATKKCEPCAGGVEPLTGEALRALYKQLRSDWRVVNEHHLEKSYSFDDFAQAWTFVNRVAELAEAEDHHPEIAFGWGHAKITLWTHKIDGLAEADFVMAAKIDALD